MLSNIALPIGPQVLPAIECFWKPARVGDVFFAPVTLIILNEKEVSQCH